MTSGFSPDFIDRHGPAWKVERVNKTTAMLWARGSDHITRRIRHMNQDLENAAALGEEALIIFNKTLNAVMQKETEISTAAKKVGGQVRDATHKLAEGLAKLESTANFDRLERMINLFERAEKAITSLAELDAAGKLERIAAVLK